jgi:hypothetical protein
MDRAADQDEPKIDVVSYDLVIAAAEAPDCDLIARVRPHAKAPAK